MKAARLLFAGTPAFALASLRALVEAGHEPVAVLTQPDRPAGRGKKLASSPVKDYALQKELPVLQPVSLKDDRFVDALRLLEADLMIVAAYGLLLPQAVLDLPRRGCVNVHASLLPRWRGAAPIQRAILAGDEETGVCLMRMEAGLDTGPVYGCRRLPIGAGDTAGDVHDGLAALGGELLIDMLGSILDGSCRAKPQDASHATYAAKIRTQDAALDWTAPAAELARRVRAFNPVPGAFFHLGDERIKCWSAEPLEHAAGHPGVVTNAGKDGVDVACGDGALRLLEVQRPGRKRISAAEFASQFDFGSLRLR